MNTNNKSLKQYFSIFFGQNSYTTIKYQENQYTINVLGLKTSNTFNNACLLIKDKNVQINKNCLVIFKL
jgi:hypothetical protein